MSYRLEQLIGPDRRAECQRHDEELAESMREWARKISEAVPMEEEEEKKEEQ